MPDQPDRKFFDVAHPGKTAADAGSRPVIVSNRPMMHDPMTIQEPSVPAPSQVSSRPSADLQPVDSMTTEKPAETPSALPTTETPQAVPTVPQTQIDKLVDDQSYFVHIKGAKRRRFVSHFILFIGALIAFAAVGYYAVTFMKK